MTLQNLLRIGRLKLHSATAEEVQRLLAAVDRNQSQPPTLGVDNTTWVLLDALRRKRNANDYTGDGVTPDMVGECIAQGRQLCALLRQHLQQAHPALLQERG